MDVDSLFEQFEPLLGGLKEEPLWNHNKEEECCPLQQLIEKEGFTVCLNCGCEKEVTTINHTRLYDSHYGTGSILNVPNKIKDKISLFFDDIRGLILPENIRLEAFGYFIECSINSSSTDGEPKIFRAKLRRSIIFACVYLTCILNNVVERRENLMKFFQLNLKSALEGIRKVKIMVRSLRLVDEDIEYCISLICHTSNVIVNPNIYDYYNHNMNHIKSFKNNGCSNHMVIAVALVYAWLVNNGSKVSLIHFCELCNVAYQSVFKLYKNLNTDI